MDDEETVNTIKKLKCYIANIKMVSIATGAEITCISEEFVNRHEERN